MVKKFWDTPPISHRARLKRLNPLFVICVLVPLLAAVIYYGFIASDVYVSESRYIVRTQGKQAPSGLASLLVGTEAAGLTGNAAKAVADYATSRDAMNALNQNGHLQQIYARPEIDIFDRLSPFGGAVTHEGLHAYFEDHVAISPDAQSSITTLVVKAYRPEDAHWINEKLLRLGESLINQLNQRSRNDLVRSAQREVEEAKASAQQAATALARYRDEHEIIDPEKQAGVSLQMVSKLQDELIQGRTQLVQMRSFTPQNPQIPVLEKRIESLDREIQDEMLKVTGGRGSLAAKSAEYTRLAIEVEFTEKLLASAMTSLQNANNDARRQQAYVERIVQPNMPDKATQPRRLRGILSVFALGLVAWGVLTMLLSAMREHSL